jgi:UDP-glucose 4,6-dehydratase
MQGKPLPIHGDGSNVRSYLYCEDVAEAFEVVLHKGSVGHVYNIGTKKERTVLNVARDICNLFNLDCEKSIQFVDNRPFNDQRYFLDDAKLKEIGWQERTTWEEGLRKTLQWYTSHSDWWGDVSGALVPHPRMLSISGVEKLADLQKGPEGKVEVETSNTPNEHASPNDSSNKAGNATLNAQENGGSKQQLKFLIYGRTGWIGGLLGKICQKQGILYEYGSGRLENRAQLEADIASAKPSHVFNAAGVTGRPNVDWCESHKVETIRANVVGTLTLADVCKQSNLLLINFATGCIFEYDNNHQLGSGIGFKEEDTPNFVGSYYSKTKAMVSA